MSTELQPELLLALLNLVLVMITYLMIYPRFAGRNVNKLVVNDCLAMLISLAIAGAIFQDTGYDFSLLVIDVNWFWFSLTSYMLIETPFALRYIKKHKIFDIPD